MNVFTMKGMQIQSELEQVSRMRLIGIVVFAAVAGLLFILLVSIISMRWLNPSVTAFTQQEDWQALDTEQYNLRDHWVSSEDLPDHLKWAVIAAEDQLFYEHFGFDIGSITDAMEDRDNEVRSRGASTITQQVAKNLYLWPGQSMLRKGIEAGIAVLIELFWPKDRILEVYLNIAEFGPGVYGVGKASREYYDAAPSQLQPEMSARLAAVLPSPKRMRVNPPSPFVKRQSQWILRNMTQLSGIPYLPQEDRDETKDQYGQE